MVILYALGQLIAIAAGEFQKIKNTTYWGGVFWLPLPNLLFSEKHSPSYCCGARQSLHPSKRACTLPTAATRSGRSSCHRQRSLRSLPPSPRSVGIAIGTQIEDL